jgi:hypothetical protein
MEFLRYCREPTGGGKPTVGPVPSMGVNDDYGYSTHCGPCACRWRRQSVEKRVCCSIQLSYRTREGTTRIRTGNPQINVVPPAFAATEKKAGESACPTWRQRLTRVSEPFGPEARVEPARTMYSRRHSPAHPERGRRGNRTRRGIVSKCSPASIRPLPYITTASMRAIQWSASSCPAANAEITSNTRSENPPMLRMSARSAACVVWFG